MEPLRPEERIPVVTNDNDIIRDSLASADRFAEIFERHISAVTAYVARRVGPTASDDIVSETFLAAFRRRKRYDLTRPSALPWLLGIATKVLSQHRREQAAHWRTLQSAFAQGEPDTVDDLDRSVSRLDASSAVEDLFPRITALSTRDREVLFLHAWGDLTYQEIATALGIPIGTVRSRLSRIRAKLTAPPPAAPARATHAPRSATTHIHYTETEPAHGRL